MAVRVKEVSARRRGEAGFSLVQVVVAIAVIGIVSGFAVVRMAVARDQMSLTNAAREFAGLTEKSRLDSIRRHENGGSARVTISGASSYQVLLDFNYTGSPVTRTYTLPDGVTFGNVEVTQPDGTVVNGASLPLSITFDWRGRTGSAYRITMANTRQHTSVISITSAGEVSLDRNSVTLLAGDYDEVSGDLASIGPGSSGGSSESGGSTGGGGSGDDGGDGGGGGGSTGGDGGSTGDDGGSTGGDGGSTGGDGGSTTGGDGGSTTGGDGGSTGDNGGSTSTGGNTTGSTAPCTMTVSPSRLDLHNSGNNTPQNGTFTVTFNNPPVTGVGVTAREDGGHLDITVSGLSVNVASKNGSANRGNFDVVITPTNSACGSAQTMSVSVAN